MDLLFTGGGVLRIKTLVCILFSCSLSLAHASTQVKESVHSGTILHVCKPSDGDINALACNMFKEARGEGPEGMLAVGLVTINRKESKRFPSGISGVVYQNKQFSWANGGNTPKIKDRSSWEAATKISSTLIHLHDTFPTVYRVFDFTKGATHYHTKSIRPYWSKKMRVTVEIGNHILYREDS